MNCRTRDKKKNTSELQVPVQVELGEAREKSAVGKTIEGGDPVSGKIHDLEGKPRAQLERRKRRNVVVPKVARGYR